MGIAERKDRERAAREHRIAATARKIAQAEGWSAVTMRRLAEEIEYSQPVLYSHFANKDAIVAVVALEGFRDLTSALRQAAEASTDPRDAVRKVANAYLAFAGAQPALYEAMFTMPGLRFAEEGTRPELSDAFAALANVIKVVRSDVDVATEAFWASLHGLAALEHAGRMRPRAHDERVALIVGQFTAS